VAKAEDLRRDVGFFGLLWISTGTDLGSGWLFGAFAAVTIAGPAALLAWVIAAGIIILLALVHAELGAMFPESGGTGRFPHYAFGSLAGATFGWFSYVQAATIAPIEVLAAIEYLSTASWASGLYHPSTGTLSPSGIVVAILMMLAFVTVNLLGIRWLSRANSVITIWKVAIPIATVAILLATHFHPGNFTAAGGFFIHDSPGPAESILRAITGGGIVFSLMGFEGALQVGGESAHPARDLPRAVIGAVLLCTLIYVGAQIAFIGALEPSTLLHYGTWTNLATDTNLAQAPFFALTAMLGLVWLSTLLRVDAVISPSGTGLLYLTSASRLSFGLSRSGYIPRIFLVEEHRRRVPILGVLLSAGLGLLFLLPFPSWGKLVSVVTGAAVLMYAGAPLALGALRRSRPEAPRGYRLPAARLLAPVAFVAATLIVYWSGWQTVSTLMLVLLVGYGLMGLARALKLDEEPPAIEWAAAWWLFPYLVGISLVSYLGNFGPGGILGGVGPFHDVLVGGQGAIPLWTDMVVLSAFSLVVYAGAMAQATRAPTLSEPEPRPR
jgi:amino acid transporter